MPSNATATLLSRYQAIGIVDSNENGLALHRSCPRAGTCWSGCEDRFPSDKPSRSAIALPFVGNRFDDVGLLVLGINQNDWGGLGALEQLIRDARAEIRQGKIRVFQSAEYSGSPIWHRVGCFAAAFAEANGRMNLRVPVGGLPSSADVDQAYEFMAFTNHVKCSPRGERSKPNEEMWTRCGELILPEEIRALSPKAILVLGVGDNAWALTKTFLRAAWNAKQPHSDVRTGSGSIDGRSIPMYAVPHPSLGKGLRVSLFHELRQVLADQRS